MPDFRNKARRLLLTPLTRISFGLVMLTVSLLLISDMLGLIPDERASELKFRSHIAENIAVQVSLEIESVRVEKLVRIIDATVARNERVLSVAVVQATGAVLYASSEHVDHWTLSPDQESTPNQMRVELYSQAGLWGRVEIAFQPLDSGFLISGAGNALLWIILYVAVAGFLAYFFFLKKVLKELDPEHAVPERVRTALDTLTEGLMILDVDKTIIFVNHSLAEKIGFEVGSIVGKTVSSLEWSTEAGVEKPPWEQALAGHDDWRETTSGRIVNLSVGYNKSYRFVTNISEVLGGSNEPRGLLVTLNDISEVEKHRAELESAMTVLETTQSDLTQKNKELYRLATRDALTGVFNRRAFFEAFDSLFQETQKSRSSMCCIMVDIDHFKAVNDTFGHSVGDSVIQYLADALTRHAGTHDIVGRFGGEEFCILLPDTETDEALFRAETIRAGIESGEKATFNDQLSITASFGVSFYTENIETPQELLDNADKALYAAKGQGRNRVIGWSLALQHGNVIGADSPLPLTEQSEEAVESNHKERRKAVPVEVRPTSIGAHRSDELGAQVLLEPIYKVTRRSLLLNSVEQALKRGARFDREVAVCVLDCTALHEIAETVGYAEATQISSVLVDRVKNVLRNKDIVSQAILDPADISVAQTDMHEIAVLISDVDSTDSFPGILRRLLLAFDQRIVVDGFEYKLHTCIGASVAGIDGSGAEELLQKAGIACSALKARGEYNEFLFHASELDEAAKRELRIRSDLEMAIDREELEVYYQPKMDITTGSLHGFEALVRWRHRELNYIPPDEFIPIAEKYKMITRLNAWVVSEVATQLKRWSSNNLNAVPVAINLSAVELKQPDLFASLDGIITTIGVEPSLIEFELTESRGLDGIETVRSTLNSFSQVGYTISVDDFGTGYASMSYLQRFPVDRLKIDRFFVNNLGFDEKADSVVRSVIMLGHSLGMRVLAEGVETEEQLRFLRNHHCDEIQGYLVSKPVNVAQATSFLQNRRVLSQKIHALNLDLSELRSGDTARVGVGNHHNTIVTTFSANDDVLSPGAAESGSSH